MRHLKRTAKLGRTSEHRNAMLANLVCSLIEHKRVTTTLAKAKAARSVAEKMVTLGKKGTLHHRRLAVARLHQESAAKILFKEIAPAFKDRRSGYTRIIRLEHAPRATPPSARFWNGWTRKSCFFIRPAFRADLGVARHIRATVGANFGRHL
jgi:large subunit ribosomal protein L17